MAFYGLSAAIPTTIGPVLAGLILDNFNPTCCGIWAVRCALFLRWAFMPSITSLGHRNVLLFIQLRPERRAARSL
jgi:hypothetical protein